MKGVDPYSINGAIANAKSQKKNVYILEHTINRDGVVKLTDSIHRIPGRIRICFKDGLILAEAVEQFGKLFGENLDFDALIFINTQIQNFPGFCEALGRCASLSILSFTSCRLTDSDFESLNPILKKLIHLQTIDISHDHIGPVMFSNMCHALCANSELESFHWNDNQLGDPAAFVELVKSVPSLRKVDLSGIILTDQWVEALSQLLDESWQLCDVRVTDITPTLRAKIDRNNMRNEMMRKGPSRRMAAYAIPDIDDIFDEF
ncbi:hypothetical protein TRFO_05886 [Tritrichomonas foetus]|uniref:Leucine Rich Repeat family protein n=1 Tax=Tritrichomonas foetus TaxID=1144522 RepID=A0A1J4K4F4_9EUKA|nr:hypothetical protein TRFO_05886 [Tritrichomonas foetus]|eukprot:OHT05720.1 hypothetical protein TRFO_05886 [Tritrichomonas foetus]